MARQIIHRLIDDINGGDADETVLFSLDGVNYEIDLSTANGAKLRGVLADYIVAGTRVGRGGVTKSAGPSGDRMSRDELHTVREYARKGGREVSDRGRIPQDIMDAYRADPVNPPAEWRAATAAPAATFSDPETPVEAVKADGAPVVTQPVKKAAAKRSAVKETAAAS